MPVLERVVMVPVDLPGADALVVGANVLTGTYLILVLASVANNIAFVLRLLHVVAELVEPETT